MFLNYQKKKSAIVIEDELIMFRRPTIYSEPLVVLQKGRLTKIIKCNEEWCKASSSKYKGWIKKEGLWGLL